MTPTANTTRVDEADEAARREARRRSRRARRKARRRGRRAERGVALLLVLTSLALLYVLAQQSRDEVEVYSTAAAVSRDQVIAHYQARSVVNLSRLLIHSEPAIRRALTPILAPMLAIMGRGLSVPQIPVWEQADLLLGAFRNREGGQQFGQAVGVDFSTARGLGALTGVEPAVIVDEDSKINVNGLERGSHIARRLGMQLFGLVANPRYEPFFTGRDADGQFTDRITLVREIIDYADSNTEAFDAQSLGASSVSGSGGGGPEDNFYSLVNPPYLRRNAPLDSVEELRMVRGLSDDDIWGTLVDPEPGSPHRRTLTVWGQGPVNVNTANPQTLLAVICANASGAHPACVGDPVAAQTFIDAVGFILIAAQGMGVPLFNSPQMFVQTIQGQGPIGMAINGMLATRGLQPFQVAGPQLEQAITVESKVFSIYAEAVVGSAHTRIHAVIDMRPQPAIPGTFRSVMGGREQSAGQATVTTQTGQQATITSAGGTVIYWRED